MHRFVVALALAGIFSTSIPVAASVVNLAASKDNTMYSDQPTASNGVGNGIFAGETSDPSGTEFRRGLIAFDLSSIPAGSTITSVQLSLFSSKARSVAPSNVSIYRVSKIWGEGTSDAINNPLPGGGGGGGGGAAATNGDATWNDEIYNTGPASEVAWTNPGGDFALSPSATTSLTGSGVTYTWGSTAKMVADVQAWVNASATNFGWAIVGDEDNLGSARRFDSRETTTPGQAPALIVNFTPAPEPTSLALVGIAAFGLSARRLKK